jgi:nucleoid DNA-binding protein
MAKAQLVESVAGDTGRDKSEVERTLESILERASNALTAGDRVELRGFGSFEVKAGRNLATGAPIEIPASRKASFRPSKELKERLNGKAEAIRTARSQWACHTLIP